MIGSILSNRYRILRDLGTGGMAKVYLAEDINQSQLVAVKVLHAQYGEDLAYLQRFKREAKLASLLDNPNLVKIIDYGSSRDIHFLVMEYVQGQDLRQHLDEKGALSWQEALHILDHVCAALENAHAHNIVHRDIKPQNIMLADNGDVKVLDFGIARARLLPSLTQSGFVGSPYYIAPEQAMGEAVDIRSDLYSSGIVLYELLLGHVPFDSKSPWSIISKHIISEFPTLDTSEMDIPVGVDSLLKKLVAKRPEDRYQTPTEAREAISALLAGSEIPATDFDPNNNHVDAPTLVNDLFVRAEDDIKREDWQNAVKLLNQLLNLNPDHTEAAEKLAFVGAKARLSALRQAAIRAMENQRWQEAIDELTEILETDPEFKDSHELIEQAKKALQQSENPPTEIPKPNEKKSKKTLPKINLPVLPKNFPWQWVSVTVLVVIAIVIATFYVSKTITPTNDPTLSSENLYATAESAFAKGDSAKALAISEQILAQEPTFTAAQTLKEQAELEESYAQKYNDSLSAIAAKDWTKALLLLDDLQKNAASYADTVPPLMCDTYLARGVERLTRVSSPKDRATIQAALADFEAGQNICTDNPNLATQISLANSYLNAQAPGTTADEIIAELQPIVKEAPDYAGGQAAQILYDAYLQRGEDYLNNQDFESALDDFVAAQTLTVKNTDFAQEKQAFTLKLISGEAELPTPTLVKATVATTPPPEKATPALTNTSSTYKYAAPKLISPDPEAQFNGQFADITLTWEAIDGLSENDFYDVTIRYFVGDEARYWGSGLIKETSWHVPTQAGYKQAGKDEIWWWVTVREGGTAANGNPDIALSPSSEERIFIWKP